MQGAWRSTYCVHFAKWGLAISGIWWEQLTSLAISSANSVRGVEIQEFMIKDFRVESMMESMEDVWLWHI